MTLRLAVWVSSVTLAVACSVQGDIVPVYFVGTNSQAPAQMALDVVTGDYRPGTSSGRLSSSDRYDKCGKCRRWSGSPLHDE